LLAHNVSYCICVYLPLLFNTIAVFFVEVLVGSENWEYNDVNKCWLNTTAKQNEAPVVGQDWVWDVDRWAIIFHCDRSDG